LSSSGRRLVAAEVGEHFALTAKGRMLKGAASS
jgi:hypothetical protein